MTRPEEMSPKAYRKLRQLARDGNVPGKTSREIENEISKVVGAVQLFLDPLAVDWADQMKLRAWLAEHGRPLHNLGSLKETRLRRMIADGWTQTNKIEDTFVIDWRGQAWRPPSDSLVPHRDWFDATGYLIIGHYTEDPSLVAPVEDGWILRSPSRIGGSVDYRAAGPPAQARRNVPLMRRVGLDHNRESIERVETILVWRDAEGAVKSEFYDDAFELFGDNSDTRYLKRKTNTGPGRR